MWPNLRLSIPYFTHTYLWSLDQMCALGHCLTSEVGIVCYVKNGLLLLVNNLRLFRYL